MLNVTTETPQEDTAFIIGPVIYGKGQGPVNQRSVQIPAIAKVTLDRRRGVQVGKGLNRWGTVHVVDLGGLFALLLNPSGNDKTKNDIGNPNGIFITSTEETSFGHMSSRVASSVAKLDLIPDDKVDELLGDEANKVLPAGTVLFGTNVRGIGRRAQELLDWKPKNKMEDEFSRLVWEEAKVLGL